MRVPPPWVFLPSRARRLYRMTIWRKTNSASQYICRTFAITIIGIERYFRALTFAIDISAVSLHLQNLFCGLDNSNAVKRWIPKIIAVEHGAFSRRTEQISVGKNPCSIYEQILTYHGLIKVDLWIEMLCV